MDSVHCTPGHTGSERSVYALPMPTAPAQPAAPGLAKAMGACDRRIAHARGGRHRDAMARPRVPQCPTRLVFGVAARLVGGMGRARGVHTRMGARIGVRSPHSTHYFARARGPNTPSHLQCMCLSPPVCSEIFPSNAIVMSETLTLPDEPTSCCCCTFKIADIPKTTKKFATIAVVLHVVGFCVGHIPFFVVNFRGKDGCIRDMCANDESGIYEYGWQGQFCDGRRSLTHISEAAGGYSYTPSTSSR